MGSESVLILWNGKPNYERMVMQVGSDFVLYLILTRIAKISQARAGRLKSARG